MSAWELPQGRAAAAASTRRLRGLEKICRLYGRIKCGETLWVWDYVNEKAVHASAMPPGSARWEANEQAKWAMLKAGLTEERPLTHHEL